MHLEEKSTTFEFTCLVPLDAKLVEPLGIPTGGCPSVVALGAIESDLHPDTHPLVLVALFLTTTTT